MTIPLAPISIPPTTPRPVLLWHPDRDEYRVEPGVAQAALFLDAPAGAVLAAIDAGDLLHGWFVDWDVKGRPGLG